MDSPCAPSTSTTSTNLAPETPDDESPLQMSKPLAALFLAISALPALALPLPGNTRPLPPAFKAPPVPTEFHVADPNVPVFVGCQNPTTPEV